VVNLIICFLKIPGESQKSGLGLAQSERRLSVMAHAFIPAVISGGRDVLIL
jgi:hypothetical protein